MTKQFISAGEFQLAATLLAKKIFDDPTWQPELILALWRGGAQPGVILSEVFEYLGRPTKHTIVKCASYAGIGDRNDEVTFDTSAAVLADIPAGCRVLVVDDVFDTGKTAESIKARLAHTDLRIAAVYSKPSQSLVPFQPDYVVHETDKWLVFPHELVGLTPEEVELKDPQLAAILKQ